MKSIGIVIIVSLLVIFSGITLQKDFASKATITPWQAVGGCGPYYRDSLAGTWVWFRSCGGSSFVCFYPETKGFNKYLKFASDSAYSFKNDSLIAAVFLDTTIPSYLGFPGIGLNNGRTPVSYLLNTFDDTIYFDDSCYINDDCMYRHYYMRQRSNIIYRSHSWAAPGCKPGVTDGFQYYTLKGERVQLRPGQRIQTNILIKRNPGSGKSHLILLNNFDMP